MRPVQAVKKNRRLRQPVITAFPIRQPIPAPTQRRGSTMIGRIVTVHARYALYLLMLSLSVLLVAPTATGCASSQPDDTVTLRVFAASSLTEALTEAAAAFEAENDGVRIETHFAGSSRLRAQIEEGARADVFISADRRQIDEVEGLLIDSSQVTIAANKLVVAVTDTNGPIRNLSQLDDEGIRIVMALPDVPAGRYARLAISEIDGEPGFVDGVLANVVSEEANVRAVLAKVLLGEADAGFVYRTDVNGTDLTWIEIPVQETIGILYEAAVLRESSSPDLAHEYLEYLSAGRGQDILQTHGFLQRGDAITLSAAAETQ